MLICIAREFGSGGYEIGKLLAEKGGRTNLSQKGEEAYVEPSV